LRCRRADTTLTVFISSELRPDVVLLDIIRPV
jgi:hypothetical protein